MHWVAIRGRLFVAAWGVVGAVSLAPGCASESRGGQDCDDLGLACDDFSIPVVITDAAPGLSAGTYVVVVSTDSVTETLTCGSPAPPPPDDPWDWVYESCYGGTPAECGMSACLVIKVGDEQQPQQTVTVQVFREGVELASRTFAPRYRYDYYGDDPHCGPECTIAEQETITVMTR